MQTRRIICILVSRINKKITQLVFLPCPLSDDLCSVYVYIVQAVTTVANAWFTQMSTWKLLWTVKKLVKQESFSKIK